MSRLSRLKSRPSQIAEASLQSSLELWRAIIQAADVMSPRYPRYQTCPWNLAVLSTTHREPSFALVPQSCLLSAPLWQICTGTCGDYHVCDISPDICIVSFPYLSGRSGHNHVYHAFTFPRTESARYKYCEVTDRVDNSDKLGWPQSHQNELVCQTSHRKIPCLHGTWTGVSLQPTVWLT